MILQVQVDPVELVVVELVLLEEPVLQDQELQIVVAVVLDRDWETVELELQMQF